MKFSPKNWVPASLSLMLLVGAAGCEDSDQTPPADFQLQTTLIEAHALADVYSAEYTLRHPRPGVGPTASSDRTWVHSFNTEAEGSIVFEVDENPVAEPREATVRVVYADIETSFRIAQAAAELPGFDISLDAADVTEASVTYTVIPEQADLTYLSMVVGKDEFDAFESDEAYFQDDLEFFRTTAESQSKTLAEYLATLLKQGEVTAPVYNLEPDTPYYAYVYGLTPEGTRTTDIHKREFRTRKVDRIDVPFSLSFQVMNTDVRMKVDPGSYDGYYMFDMVEASSAGSTADIVEMMQQYIDNYINIYSMLGVTPNEAVTRFASQGPASYLYDESAGLKPDTEYLGFALAITPLGKIRSVPVTRTTRTENAGSGGEEALAITLGEITTESVVVSVKSTIEDHYVVGITPSYVWTGMTDEEILARLLDNYQWQSRGATGDYTTTFYGLQPQNSYSVLAFGYVGGEATTKLYRTDFTAAKGDVADISFKFCYDKYFDGDALAATDDAFAPAKGRAVLPFRIETEGDELYEVYYEAYEGDLSDTEEYPDAELLPELIEIGLWEMEGNFIFSYDVTYTVIGFSVNMDEKFGPISREVITLDRAGVSPVTEYPTGRAPQRLSAARRTPAPVNAAPTTLDRLVPTSTLLRKNSKPQLLRPVAYPDGTPALRRPKEAPAPATHKAVRHRMAE